MQIKQILCGLFFLHRWKLKSLEPTGFVTMGWTVTAEREFECTLQCKRCGKEKVKGGYLCPGDRPARNEKGWPLDENGNQLPVKHFKR